MNFYLFIFNVLLILVFICCEERERQRVSDFLFFVVGERERERERDFHLLVIVWGLIGTSIHQ